MRYLPCFHFPLIPSSGAMPILGVGTSLWVVSFQLWQLICLVGHWLVTEALLWLFIVVVFPFCKVEENWPAVSLTHACARTAACLNVQPGAHPLKVNKVHRVQRFPSIKLYSSGDLLKVSTCQQSEERTMPVCCQWRGSVGRPRVHFSFLSSLRSALDLSANEIFLKGKK